jgi:hypothetical protein
VLFADEVDDVVDPLESAAYFARERGPNIPLAERPFAACHFFTAAFVPSRKRLVSFPTEPTPLDATVYPAPFKYFWRQRTSSPWVDVLKSRVKLHAVVARAAGTATIAITNTNAPTKMYFFI